MESEFDRRSGLGLVAICLPVEESFYAENCRLGNFGGGKAGWKLDSEGDTRRWVVDGGGGGGGDS